MKLTAYTMAVVGMVAMAVSWEIGVPLFFGGAVIFSIGVALLLRTYL